MFIVRVTFKIANGSIVNAGVTPFSHCPNDAAVEAAFADYAKDIGYTEFAGENIWINRDIGEGVVAEAAFTVEDEAKDYADHVAAAAQRARVAATAARLTIANRRQPASEPQPARIPF